MTLKKKAAAVIGTAALVAGMSLGAASSAQAAVNTLNPTYAASSTSVPPLASTPLAGIEIRSVGGQPTDPSADTVALTGNTNITASFSVPKTAAGKWKTVKGNFTIGYSRTAVQGTTTVFQNREPVLSKAPKPNRTWDGPGSPATATTLLADSRIDSSGGKNVHTYNFDFSGLEGGVLPTGSVVTALDVDVINSQSAESIVFASSATTPWLAYVAEGGPATEVPPVVTYDTTARNYMVAANPQDVDNNLQSWFRTTQNIKSLTVTVENATSGGLAFDLRVPTTAVADVTAKIDSVDNGARTADISGTGEPGATVVVKDDTGKEVGTITVGPDGKWGPVVVPNLKDGDNPFVVEQLVGGTKNGDAQVTATIDPVAGITAKVDNVRDDDGTDAEPSSVGEADLSGTGDPGAIVVIKDADGKELARTEVDEDGNWSTTVTGLPVGENKLTAYQVDGDGKPLGDPSEADLEVITVQYVPVAHPAIAGAFLVLLLGAGVYVARRRQTGVFVCQQ